MDLGNLQYAPGSRKKRKRLGIGEGSGHGGTSTKGHKGQLSRAGTKTNPWFEGGQMPLVRRIPKFGFHSPFKVQFQIVNVATLEVLAAAGKIPGGEATPESLYAVGAVSKKSLPVKILGDGELKAKLKVSAHAFSKSAVQKIESVGGKATTLQLVSHKVIDG